MFQINENVGPVDGKSLLLGNKVDEVPVEDEKRDPNLHVLRKDAASWAQSQSLQFAEVSAKTGFSFLSFVFFSDDFYTSFSK
jgi:hypothetical protein